jgi:hypothetical protein
MPCLKRLSVVLALLLLLNITLLSGGEPGDEKKVLAKGSYSIPASTNNKAYMHTPEIPVTYWELSTGQIGALFDNTGAFGTGYASSPICGEEECPSFESPEGSDLEYLFAGGIWIGGIVGDDTLVSVGADGWFMIQELWPDHPAAEFDGISDYSVWTHFTDTITDASVSDPDPYDNRPHLPLSLRIANRAHVWNSDPENNLVIYDLVITNIGDETIHDGYTGFHFDADVFHKSIDPIGWMDDLTGALRDEGIAYIIDNDGDPEGGEFVSTSPIRLFAFKYLSASFNAVDTSYDWWISNGNPSLDFGPQPVDEYGNVECNFGEHTGTPTGDASKYCILSHPGWDYDQIYTPDTNITGWSHPRPDLAINFADGYDTKFLMSLGPFDLAPDSSVRILVTTFTGDSVHQVVDNIDNVYENPDQYLANLNFTHAISNAAVADSLAQLLVDPNLPVTGLQVVADSYESIMIEWDPFGAEGIDGYEVYLYTVPQDSMPYPDVIPPWLELDDLSVMDMVAGTGMAYWYTFDTLQISHFYFASVANQIPGKTGQLASPIVVRPGGRIPAPAIDELYEFFQVGEEADLEWMEPEGVDVDYYIIYELPMWDTATYLYYPLYDTGEFSQTAPPVDSFYREDQWYYYYAMNPYAQVDSSQTSFSDFLSDSTCYYITAVDKFGLESEFSDPITVFVLDPFTPKDILVLNCNIGTIQADRVLCDSLEYFYEYALGSSCDRYTFPDTLDIYSGLKQDFWRDLIPYRMVIIDGGLGIDLLKDSPFLPTAYDFEKYIHSGGKLAYFGSFAGMRGENHYAPPAYYSLKGYWFIEDYFGADSIFQIGWTYYFGNSDPPYIDSLTGLVAAIPTRIEIPYLSYNPLTNALGVLSEMWPEGTAPSPSAFRVNKRGRTLYRAEVMYPETSLIDNHSIGVKTSVAGTATYLFGFHLWYMDPIDAASLVDYILWDSPEIDYQCGDASGNGIVDIGDAVFLINFIWRDGAPPEPYVAGDANGDGFVNIGDVVQLIDYVFRDGPSPECK